MRHMRILVTNLLSFVYVWIEQDRGNAGGESGIRTHVRVSPKHAFQACAFSHSAISPRQSPADCAFARGAAIHFILTEGIGSSRPPRRDPSGQLFLMVLGVPKGTALG